MNEANLWCPVCDWTEPRTFVAYAVSNAVAAPSVAAALGMPADALLSIHQHQNAKRDEATLKRHLSTHGPEDWLPVIMRARTTTQRVRDLCESIEPATPSDRLPWDHKQAGERALAQQVLSVLDSGSES